MNVNTSVKRPNEEADVAAGIRQYLAKGLLAKLFMVAILFLSAGRLDWVMGWALVGVYVGWDIVTVLILVPRRIRPSGTHWHPSGQYCIEWWRYSGQGSSWLFDQPQDVIIEDDRHQKDQ